MGKPIIDGKIIQGVVVEPLKQIIDDRGCVMHMLRSDSPLYERFGEIYFSTVKAGIVKAWKKHAILTQHLAVPVGRIRVIIYDDRANSRTNGWTMEIITGAENYALIKIPAGVWYGFQGLATNLSLIANCTDFPYDESDVIRVDPKYSDIPYNW